MAEGARETEAGPRGFVLAPPEGARIIDTGAARWWSEGDWVCNQSYVEGVTAEQIRAGMRAALELSGGRKVPLLAESGPMSRSTREAREVLAGPEAAAVFSAFGFVVRSPVARTIISLFVRISGPSVPVKMFGDADSARAWARAWTEERRARG
ncbi:MAG: hypothetical protein U0353_24500 [Sandaracinus sp.]